MISLSAYSAPAISAARRVQKVAPGNPGRKHSLVKTTDDCPSDKQGLGGCYPGKDFLKNQIASTTGLAQTAEWTDENLKFVVGTMADQIVATIC